MKKLLIVLALPVLFQSLAMANNSQDGINFTVSGGSVTYKYQTSLSGPFIMILSKAQSGVKLSILTTDRIELATITKIVGHLKANLKSSSYRMFSESGTNEILITTGKRSQPTEQDLNLLLDEVGTLIKPKATELRLISRKSVELNGK